MPGGPVITLGRLLGPPGLWDDSHLRHRPSIRARAAASWAVSRGTLHSGQVQMMAYSGGYRNPQPVANIFASAKVRRHIALPAMIRGPTGFWRPP